MKRLALILTTVVAAGWACPVMASEPTMQDKLFRVTVWEGGLFGGATIIDEGFLWLRWYDPDDQAEQFEFWSCWSSNRRPYMGAWDEEDNVDPAGRHDSRWCSWDAKYNDEDVEPWPFDDFTGYYFKPTGEVIGLVQRTNEYDDLLFYGELW